MLIDGRRRLLGVEQVPGATWAPMPGPQSALLACPVNEILYGGAVAGGKSDGLLGDWLIHAMRYGPNAAGLLIRRTLQQLRDLIKRAKQIYLPLGARYLKSDKVFLMPGGAVLTLAYLDSDDDAEHYQGWNLTWIGVDEAGNFPSAAPIDVLRARLRSGSGVPTRLIMTANPGGAGHQWLKARFIDPHPSGWKTIIEGSQQRVYIPARIRDNLYLLQHDPGYVDRLSLLGSRELVRALVDGDWSVVQGAYFDGWSHERHVVQPHTIPQHWTRIRGYDWGYSSPFAVYWGAVSDGTLPQYPAGAIVIYREWYGWNGKPNEGARMDDAAVARGIRERDGGDKIDDSVADPSIFANKGGVPTAETMYGHGVTFRRGDNERLAGWQQIRGRLAGDGDGRPMLYVFGTCTHLIRTLPALQHDKTRAEDLDTDGEDHAADALRYLVMARPWVRQRKPTEAEAMTEIMQQAKRPVTIDDVMKQARQQVNNRQRV